MRITCGLLVTLSLAAGCGSSSPGTGGAGGKGAGGAAAAGGTNGIGGMAGAAGGGTAAGGASGASGASGGGSAGTAGLGGAVGEDAAFIVADVDGVSDRAVLMADAWRESASNTTTLIIEATSSKWQWMLRVTNSVGPGACTAGWVRLLNASNLLEQYWSATTDGTCDATVTTAAPAVGDLIEGTFSGVLPPLGATATTTVTVTNGRFRVPRIADRLNM